MEPRLLISAVPSRLSPSASSPQGEKHMPTNHVTSTHSRTGNPGSPADSPTDWDTAWVQAEGPGTHRPGSLAFPRSRGRRLTPTEGSPGPAVARPTWKIPPRLSSPSPGRRLPPQAGPPGAGPPGAGPWNPRSLPLKAVRFQHLLSGTLSLTRCRRAGEQIKGRHRGTTRDRASGSERASGVGRKLAVSPALG